MWQVVLLICSTMVSSNLAARHMELINSWNVIDYAFPSDDVREEMLKNGSFIPGNSEPISVSVDYKGDRLFITMPRIKPGNPATLAIVSKTKKDERGQPLLEPYPSWDWHNEGDCNGMFSIYRTRIDDCGRMWAIDTGTIGSHADPEAGIKRICPPALFLFDLETDQLIKRFLLPDHVIVPESLLITVAVDVIDTAQKCEKTFVYVADVTGFGIIVFDSEKKDFWRMTANELYPYPNHGHFKIAGDEFDLMNGVLSLAMPPKRDNQERSLYFHSLAAVNEFWISTHVLQNKSNFPSTGSHVSRHIHQSKGERDGQASTSVFDKNGVKFFSILPHTSVNCWNSKTEYTKSNIYELDHDREGYQFILGVNVVTNKKGKQELWILSSRFNKLMTARKFDVNEVNFRIFMSDIATLTKGTPCASGTL